jgi:hypothetical protein
MEFQEMYWDFTPVSSTKLPGAFRLRVFSNLEEYFRSGRSDQATDGFEIYLPPDLFLKSSGGRSRAPRSIVAYEEALAIGQQLWDLLPASVTAGLTDNSRPSGQALRIKISSTTSIINDIPWEWLADNSQTPLSLRPDIEIVRAVPVLVKSPPLTVKPPLRVLLLITNPKDETLLIAEQEINAVCGRLLQPDYELEILKEPTAAAAQETLKRFEPHIVHYIGHAGISSGEGNLILHDDSSNVTHWISGNELAPYLPLSVRLLCLSTCFTTQNYQILGLPRFAHSSPELKLPAMIANQYPVTGDSVRAYWNTFYDGFLTQGCDIVEASHMASLAVKAASPALADWGSFSVVLRNGTDVLFKVDHTAQHSPEQFAHEIQAQFASRVANDLADKLRALGADASEGEVEHLQQEISRVGDITKNIN